MLSRRSAAFVIAILFAGVLISLVTFSRQQAEERRLDAEVFARLRAISIAATDGNLTVEEVNEFWNRASAEVLAHVGRLQIPVVITDANGNPTSSSHLPDDFPRAPDGSPDPRALRDFARELDRVRPHFEAPGVQVHFGDPEFLGRLKWMPWLQAASLLMIVGGGAWIIFTSFRSERERIWSAMARESAHQMGTPLSSLSGWLETLETSQSPRTEPAKLGEFDLIDEMSADVERLRKVSRRFELIGHQPTLELVSVRDTVEHLKRYFEARLPTLARSGQIGIDVDIPAESPRVLGNVTLLEWAFENLIKNAVDAIAPGRGRISITHLGPNAGRSVYRVSDSGPGIPAALRRKIFEIGFTTKERGWGAGLSLTRRIIEDVHEGVIQLEDTTHGASFRIELPREPARRGSG